MSYILKALARAEQERQLGQAPELAAALQQPDTAPRAARWRGWVVPIAIVAAVAIAALLYFQGYLPAGSAPAVDAQPEPRAETTPQSTTAKVQVPATTPVPLPVRPVPPPKPVEVAPAKPARVPKPADTSPANAAPAPQPADVARPEQAQPAPETVASIPGIHLSVHAYSDDPHERFVYLNGHKYQEGERIDDAGRVLESITPSGIIVRDGARRVLLQINR